MFQIVMQHHVLIKSCLMQCCVQLCLKGYFGFVCHTLYVSIARIQELHCGIWYHEQCALQTLC